MRLSAKWRDSWSMDSEGIDVLQIQAYGIGGDVVEVVRLGRGDPLVVIPGLAGGWKLAWPMLRSLGRHFEVITFGLRGDEREWDAASVVPTARARGIGEYAQDVLCLINQLGLEAPAVLGLSFGGAIALELAAEHPDRLGALIVHGVEATFRPSIGSRIARRVLERFPLPSDSRFINQFFHLLFGSKPDSGPLLDFVIDRIWETGQTTMAERLAALESFNISDRLWSIGAPTLVLAGARDVIVPAVRQRALASEISGARFGIIEQAGHIGFVTHRAEVVRSVRRHIRRASAVV
jgi:pimeloyl-ACP methyl ester carboxylesterase